MLVSSSDVNAVQQKLASARARELLAIDIGRAAFVRERIAERACVCTR